MTTPDSSSAAESSMDETSNDHSHNLPSRKRTAARAAAVTDNRYGPLTDEEAEELNCNPEVWGNFTDSFCQVQSVLDRNRLLIQQVNENHRSKIHGNMMKNVALIQEINENVSKVVSLYSDLSTNFSSVFHQRNSETGAEDKTGDGDKN